MGVSLTSGPVNFGLVIAGFLLGLGGAFGYALGSGSITLVANALTHGAR